MATPPVLVCGLGSLGQACLRRLSRFDVPLRILDLQRPSWADPELEQRLDPHLVLGDMRLPHVLRAAGAEEARSVLLLSSRSTVNFEAALQVRLLNPQARIVARSSSQQAEFAALLEEKLPGIAVLDPVLLTAEAITAALRPSRQAALFQVEGQTYGLIEGRLDDRRHQRPLQLAAAAEPPLLVTPLALVGRGVAPGAPVPPAAGRRWLRSEWSLAAARVRGWLRRRSRLQWILAGAVLALLLAGLQLFAGPHGWRQGVFVTLALLKGEYVDAVAVFLTEQRSIGEASGWLIGGTLLYALVGTLLTSALVAVILEWLLRDRLGVRRPRPPRRDRPVVLLVEGGALADRVQRDLERERCAVVRVSEQDSGAGVPSLGLAEGLALLQQRPAAALGVLSADLLGNLHTALALQQRWPQARLAVLAASMGAAEQLGDLLGGMTVISTTDLVADAIVATAFGEVVLGVCRVRGVTLLLVRYRITADDTLCGRSVARLEHGYGLTCLALRRSRSAAAMGLPRAESIVAAGDQLTVLADLDALRRVELGRARPPAWCLRLQVIGTPDAERRFNLQQCLARWLGRQPGEVLPLLDGREHHTPRLDLDISELLAQDLHHLGVRSQVVPAAGDGATRTEA
ncbi:NAD-binding protein [Cyanobium sp. CH-040]|uniref:NAD-binding protein n=1 Tax=Cyanobium sp. CH-040 TaxID=2823708 RepID=UPI0020CC4E3A|nr:NAD-binding protein [Cyanobium sp. CH-040]MCP9928412.1 NAD-binding protein [Cyanobium sp. CH-040]